VLPEIELGPVTIQTFGLSLALGLVACGLVAARRLREIGRPADWAYESVFAAGLGGLIGARLDWALQNPEQVRGDVLASLFGGTGLVFYGGLIGGAIGVLLWAWWRRFLGRQLLDLAAVPIAVGYAWGRVGCQLSGDGDYGDPSDLPWAMAYPDGTVPTTQEVHPAPVYETLAMGIVALALWQLRDRVRPGMLLALYLVLGGLERLLVEFVRRNETVAVGLTLAQLISIAMIVVGAAMLAVLSRSPEPAPT